jgi:hypothetical protein
MTDIAQRLRRKGRHYVDPTYAFMTDPLCAEAADEIERLRERCTAALCHLLVEDAPDVEQAIAVLRSAIERRN